MAQTMTANLVLVVLSKSVTFFFDICKLLVHKRILRSSTCPLTGFFWLLSHVIYLKLTKILYEWFFPKAELNDKIDQNINFAKLPSAKYYFCQLEIDHVTQQPKETCQRTCRGPYTVCIQNFYVPVYQ